MTQSKKVFPLRLNADQHKEIKEAAETSNKSMHQFILDAASKEAQKDELYNLVKRAYNFINGGPSPKLEEELLDWLINNK